MLVDKKLLDNIKHKLESLQTELFYCLSMVNELYEKAESDKGKSLKNIKPFPKKD